MFDTHSLYAEGHIDETVRAIPPQRSVLDDQEAEPTRPPQESDAQASLQVSVCLGMPKMAACKHSTKDEEHVMPEFHLRLSKRFSPLDALYTLNCDQS